MITDAMIKESMSQGFSPALKTVSFTNAVGTVVGDEPFVTPESKTYPELSNNTVVKVSLIPDGSEVAQVFQFGVKFFRAGPLPRTVIITKSLGAYAPEKIEY